ncbi:MAG: DUF5693 family protein, partial [Acidaminococcaceae bacterium]|nr:DUF5693 family protein [Acidaminococcaceae bacterium]
MKFNSLKEQSFYKLAMVIIFFGFLAASFVLTPRIGLESSNKIVSQAICHKDCYELIKAAGKDSQDIETYFETENELLKAYKSAGINTIIVHDASLERLARTGAIQLELSDGLAIVRETHEHIFDELQEIGQRRYKKQIEVYGESPNRVMEFRGSTVPVDLHDGKLKRAVQQLPFGIMSHEIKRFSKLGFNIVLAPENFWGVADKDIDILWNRVNKIGANIVGVMHAGYQMFGYPKYMKYAAEKMGRLPLILQEHWTQLGFFPVQGHLEMSRFCGYNVIRAFTIDYYEMKELELEDALRRWAIADDERNIRVNIITPFLSGSKDLIRTNIDYAKRITTNVKNRSFSIGVAKPMEVYFPNRFLLMPVIASIVAAGVLLLQLLFGWGFNRSLLLWGIVTGVALFENFTSGTITHQMLALIAAIVFPVLAVYRMTDMLDNVTDVPVIQIIANAAICLALCVVLSLCGACIMSAILTDARFLLEIDYYRGVKLTFVVPLVLMLVLCIKKYNIFDLNKCSGISEFFR